MCLCSVALSTFAKLSVMCFRRQLANAAVVTICCRLGMRATNHPCTCPSVLAIAGGGGVQRGVPGTCLHRFLSSNVACLWIVKGHRMNGASCTGGIRMRLVLVSWSRR